MGSRISAAYLPQGLCLTPRYLVLPVVLGDALVTDGFSAEEDVFLVWLMLKLVLGDTVFALGALPTKNGLPSPLGELENLRMASRWEMLPNPFLGKLPPSYAGTLDACRSTHRRLVRQSFGPLSVHGVCAIRSCRLRFFLGVLVRLRFRFLFFSLAVLASAWRSSHLFVHTCWFWFGDGLSPCDVSFSSFRLFFFVHVSEGAERAGCFSLSWFFGDPFPRRLCGHDVVVSFFVYFRSSQTRGKSTPFPLLRLLPSVTWGGSWGEEGESTGASEIPPQQGREGGKERGR